MVELESLDHTSTYEKLPLGGAFEVNTNFTKNKYFLKIFI